MQNRRVVRLVYRRAFIERDGDWFYVRPGRTDRDGAEVLVPIRDKAFKNSVGAGRTRREAWANGHRLIERGY